MRLAGDDCSSAADQEIEVCALGCLHDVLHIQLLIAAGDGRRSCFPGRSPPGEFFVRDVQVQAARVDIQFNEVAVLDEGERATGGCFRAT